MARYFCEFCNKTLANDRLKSRKMHCRGSKHGLMRRAYYMEVFENERVVSEMKSILKDMKAENARAGDRMERISGQGFSLPPGDFYLDITLPEEPPGFRLPRGFDFRDRKNFPESIAEAVRRYT